MVKRINEKLGTESLYRSAWIAQQNIKDKTKLAEGVFN
jgi:hypothetical protein